MHLIYLKPNETAIYVKVPRTKTRDKIAKVYSVLHIILATGLSGLISANTTRLPNAGSMLGQPQTVGQH